MFNYTFRLQWLKVPILPHFCLILLSKKNPFVWKAHRSKAVTATVVTLRCRVGVFLHFNIPGYMGHCPECKHQLKDILIYLLQTSMQAQQTIEILNTLNNTNYFKILLWKLQRKQNGNSEGVRSERKHQRKLLTVRHQHSSRLTLKFKKNYLSMIQHFNSFLTTWYITLAEIWTCLKMSWNQVPTHLR